MKFRIFHIVHFVVVGLFLYFLYYSIDRIFIFYALTGEKFSLLSLYVVDYLLIPLLLLPAVIGLYLKNKLGWIFICSYFYMLFTNGLVSTYKDGFDNIEVILIALIFLSLIILFLILLNSKQVSLEYYKIFKKDLLSANLSSFVIGLCISLFFLFLESIKTPTPS